MRIISMIITGLMLLTPVLKGDILYKDLLSKMPKKQAMLYSGYKLLVGKLVVEVHVERVTKNLMQISCCVRVYI